MLAGRYRHDGEPAGAPDCPQTAAPELGSSTRQELGRLARGSVAVTVFCAAGQLKGLILVAILSRFWPVAGYGRYIQAMTLLALGTALGGLQLQHALVRFLPGERDGTERARIFYEIFALVLLGDVLLVPAVCLAAYVIEPSFAGVLLAMGLLMFAKSVSGITISYYRAVERMGMFSLLVSVGLLLDLAAVCVAVLSGGGLDRALWMLTAGNAAFGITVVVSVIARLGFALPVLRRMRRYLSFSLPMAASAAAHWTILMSDRWLIALMLGAGWVGCYHPAYVLGTVVLVLPRIVGTALPPMAARLHDTSDEHTLTSVLSHYWRVLIVVGVPFVCGALVMQRPLLEKIATAEIAVNSGHVTAIIAACALLLGGIQVFSEVMKVKLRTGYVARLWGVAMLVNVGMNLILIRRLGIVAAALSSLVALTLVFALTWRQCRRYVRLPLQWGVALRCACASLPMLVLFVAVRPVGFMGACGLAMLGCLIYAVLLFPLRVIRLKRLRTVWESVRPQASSLDDLVGVQTPQHEAES